MAIGLYVKGLITLRLALRAQVSASRSLPPKLRSLGIFISVDKTRQVPLFFNQLRIIFKHLHLLELVAAVNHFRLI